ncbi:hypothetical protein [Actinoplanes philippinensis]|uniref:hypothetical protein n=1 Tax=Actinoplanes philippinensis TaxID=35752 RepID=UPI003411727C
MPEFDDPLAGLGTVRWGELHHAYGAAADVPGHPTALRSPDPDVRGPALSALASSVCHQGTRSAGRRTATTALRRMVHTPSPAGGVLVAVTAAVACAYRNGPDAGPAAVTILIDAADHETRRDVPGWSRATRGYVMRALHRSGL